MMNHEVYGKLTGAGGDGGCVIGFYEPRKNGNTPMGVKSCIRKLRKKGYTVWDDI